MHHPLMLVISLFLIPARLHGDDIDVYNTVKALPYPPYETTGDVAPPNPNYPNILFILDASLSMNRKDSGQTGRRIERLRQAMEKVLTSATKVNIAVMRFSHRNSGGRVIYPMSPIEYARDEAIAVINNMSLDYWTPTIGAMLEGTYYYRGSSVYYGTTRSTDIGNSKHRAEELTRLSHPDSYTGGQIVREKQCTEDNLDHPDCISERIDGNPVYRSPIHSECQKNYMVLLTDGAATGRVDIPAAQSLIGKNCDQSNNANTCGVEIAEFLATKDQSGIHSGTNTVITHTVGFNTTQAALVKIAAAGNGQYYQSSSADELATAMTNIIESVNIPATTLASPAIEIDTSSRLAHRKDLYVSLFKPVLRPIWPGNLKGYWLDGVLQDFSEPRITAIDPDTGTFVEDAKSMWSESPDGPVVSRGGAASRIRPANTRSVVTNHPQGTGLLLDPKNEVNANNITPQQLALPDQNLFLSELDSEKILSWVRGTDVQDANGNGDTSEDRKQYADPLHTNPQVATYGKQANGTYDSVVFFGTNDGFLNAVETLTGEDLFSFIPWSLLDNVKHSYVNLPYGEKLYGMDGYLSSWFHDEDHNGYIDAVGDHYYLYAGMRRGGRNYYALDISNKSAPELLWTIKGGTGSFTELGQSWSKMVPGKMKHPISREVTNVLVFSGGYDENQDNSPGQTEASMGRAIFIVDARSGALIWKAGAADSSLNLPEMKYSIPATPTLIDVNADGIFDQIYVSDLGGQIWRFDFAANGTIDGDVIASLSDADKGNKLFFTSPDVSLIKAENESAQIAVSIGSGARHLPLDQSQKNAFYVVLQSAVYEPPKEYGVENNEGEFKPITYDDLVDITDNSIIEGSALEIDNTKRALAEKHGWYLDMEAIGEKILNASVTIDHRVIFTSYVPAAVSACTGGLGTSYLYTLSIFDGTPVIDRDDNSIITKSDRKQLLNTPGISAPPSIVFPSSENKVDVRVGLEALGPLDINITRRTYWTELPGF